MTFKSMIDKEFNLDRIDIIKESKIKQVKV